MLKRYKHFRSTLTNLINCFLALARQVEIQVNGEHVDFPMKLGEAGEAFFVFETEQEVPEEFQTSPLVSPMVDRDVESGVGNSIRD